MVNQIITMENDNTGEVFSKVVRAGKRTYFFDVKSTKGNDLYLTITESKKALIDGKEIYQKHKIFLYKEDFEKFQEGINEALDAITEIKAKEPNFSTVVDVDFDDL